MPNADEVRQAVDLIVQSTRSTQPDIAQIQFTLDADDFSFDGANPDRLRPSLVYRPYDMAAPLAVEPMPIWSSFRSADDKRVRDWVTLVEAYTARYLTAELMELWAPLFEELEPSEDDDPYDETRYFILQTMTKDEEEAAGEEGYQFWHGDLPSSADGEDDEREELPSRVPVHPRWWARLLGR